MSSKEFNKKEICPCGSGKKYGKCCLRKDIKWFKDDEGNINRKVFLKDDVVLALKEAEEHFIEVFERKPRPGDPVFLLKYLASEADIERKGVETMRAAGLSEEYIYAWQKTGLLISENNLDVTPQGYLEDWKRAINEYFENPSELNDYELAWDSLSTELDNCIILFGYLLEKGIGFRRPDTPKYSKYIFPEQFMLICATRSFKTLRSIKYLLKNDTGSDSLALTRTIYENYLRIIFVKKHPEKLVNLVDVVIGISNGTHEYALDKKGKINRRIIVEKVTETQFDGNISNYKMALSSDFELDKDLFNKYYQFLSEFIHASFKTSHTLINNNGYIDYLGNEYYHEALFYSLFFSVIVLDELRIINVINNDIATDVKTIINRIKTKLLNVIDNFINISHENELLNILSDRIRFIGIRERICKK